MNLKELKELCENATPGPWNQGKYLRHKDPASRLRSANEINQFNEQERRIMRSYGVSNNNAIWGFNDRMLPPQEDIDFIAAARTALPQLIEFASQIKTLAEVLESWSKRSTDPRDGEAYNEAALALQKLLDDLRRNLSGE